MLLRFGFSNYRSIQEYQELFLTASSLKDEEVQLFSLLGWEGKILPGAGILGANASGKTNILLAIRFMLQFIKTSHEKGLASQEIKRTPFLLNPEATKKPSSFDCDFLLEGNRYHYGFTFDDRIVLEEWLYVFPSGSRRQVWFHRNVEENPNFYFGKFLKGKNKTIQTFTRPNSLFLSSAAQNNHEQLSRVYRYFEENFLFSIKSPYEYWNPGREKHWENESFLASISHYLKWADVGVSEIKLVKSDDYSSGEGKKILNFGHQVGDSKKLVFFKADDESRGTLSLVSLLGPVCEALEKGKVLFLDELDSSMHSLLSEKLLSLFCLPQTNPKGAQILFTAHETNLLNPKVFRRDQFWFTEKNQEGVTQLYPLTDFPTRRTDNLEKGYLEGRFGGIPILTPFEGSNNIGE